MKDGKKIIIRNQWLKKTRSNLRTILTLAIKEESSRLFHLEGFYMNEKYLNKLKPSQLKRKNYLREKRKILIKAYNNSILHCSGGFHKGEMHDKNMVYDATEKKWYCEVCYQRLLKYRSLPKGFNNGIIVQKNATKPCLKLGWCPYGYMVESFIHTGTDDLSCPLFTHDCPVFYISEEISEASSMIPQLNKKLTDDLKKLAFIKDNVEKRSFFPKPCHLLEWCPYGHVAKVYPERKNDYKYTCRLFKRDCPVYHIGLNL